MYLRKLVNLLRELRETTMDRKVGRTSKKNLKRKRDWLNAGIYRVQEKFKKDRVQMILKMKVVAVVQILFED